MSAPRQVLAERVRKARSWMLGAVVVATLGAIIGAAIGLVLAIWFGWSAVAIGAACGLLLVGIYSGVEDHEHPPEHLDEGFTFRFLPDLHYRDDDEDDDD